MSSPRSPGVLVGITVADNSPLVPLARALCVRLNLHGDIHAVFVLSSDAGGRLWLRERLALLADVALFVPFVDEPWLLAEENLLELSSALRQSIHTEGTPLVLPVLSADLDDASTLLEQYAEQNPEMPVGVPSPSLTRAINLLPLVRDAGFFLRSDLGAADMTVRITNFLRQLEFDIGVECTKVVGRGVASMFEVAVGESRKPNSGVLRVLKNEASDPEKCVRLDLGRLYFADLGAIALSATLKALPMVQTLVLCGNGINNKGVGALCAALHYHPSMTSVDLSNNIFSQAGAAELVLLTRRNRRIVEMDISDNLIGNPVWEKRVLKELQVNRERREAMKTTVISSTSALDGQLWPAWVSASRLVARNQASTLGQSEAALETTWWEVVISRNEEAVDVTVYISGNDFNDTVRPRGEVARFALSLPTATMPAKAALNVDDPEQELFGIVTAYLDEFVPSHFLSFHRINRKQLKFVLEAPNEGVELMVTKIRSLMVNKNALPGVERVLAGEQTVRVRVVECTGESQFFVEAQLSFCAGQRVGKALPQLFRAHCVSDYAGNIADEVVALVRLVNQCGSGDSDPGSPIEPRAIRENLTHATAMNVEAVKEQDRVVSAEVVQSWTGVSTGTQPLRSGQ